MQTKEDKVAEAAHQRRQQELKQQFNARIQSLEERIINVENRLEKTKTEKDESLQTRKDNWAKSQQALSSEQEKLSFAGFEMDLQNYVYNRLKQLTLNTEIAQLEQKHKTLISKGFSAEKEILQNLTIKNEKKQHLEQIKTDIAAHDDLMTILKSFNKYHEIENKIKKLVNDLNNADADSKANIKNQKDIFNSHLQEEKETINYLLSNIDKETQDQLYEQLQNTYEIIEAAYKAKMFLEIDTPNFYGKEIKKIQDELTTYQNQKQVLQDKLNNSLQTDQKNYVKRSANYSSEHIRFEELLAAQSQDKNFINSTVRYAPTIMTQDNVDNIILPYINNLFLNLEKREREEKLNQIKSCLVQMIDTHNALMNTPVAKQLSQAFNFHEKRADQLANLIEIRDEPPTNLLFKESIERLYNLEKNLVEHAYNTIKNQHYQEFLVYVYNTNYTFDLNKIKSLQMITFDGTDNNDISDAINYIFKQQAELSDNLESIYSENSKPSKKLDYEIDLIKRYQMINMRNLAQLINEKTEELHTLSINEMNSILDDLNMHMHDKIEMLTDIHTSISNQLTELNNHLNTANQFIDKELHSLAIIHSPGNIQLMRTINSLDVAQKNILNFEKVITEQVQAVRNLSADSQQENRDTQSNTIDSDITDVKQIISIDYHKEFNSLISQIRQTVQERDNEINKLLKRDFSPKKIESVNNNFINSIHDHKEKFNQLARHLRNNNDLSQEAKREIEGYIKFGSKEFNRVEQFARSYKPSAHEASPLPQTLNSAPTMKRNSL